MSRCYGCFAEKPQVNGICPHCGFIIEQYEAFSFALRPGTILKERYTIGKRLGEGGFGITYLAWDNEMQERVAIKEYYPNGIVSRDVTSESGDSVNTAASKSKEDFDEGMKRYIREAAILAKFSRLPGIVMVKDFFYANATAYIVMEYIDGISLKQYLKQKGGRLDYAETLQLIRPVISSLATIHNNNLLHRDISPDNIMLSKNGEVKLIDFGAARQFGDDNNHSMTVVLKHGYAPMEQYSRHGKQGTWTDVYAICAVIYKCLTGVTPQESVERLSSDEYVPARSAVPGLPMNVAMAIDKGLAVRIENRCQNLSELYADLYDLKSNTKSQNSGGIIKAVCIVFASIAAVLFLAIIGVVLYRAASDAGENRTESQYLADGGGDVEEADDASEDEKGDSGETETDHIEPIWMDTAKVSQGILVVSEGVLDGYTEEATVDDILDAYSDTEGTWKGYEKTDRVIIYYRGVRKGEPFDFIFDVFENDTFKLTGAVKNGKMVKNYSSMFQEALSEYGL